MVLKKKFENIGYHVITATDGEMGINMVRQERPDLILLDILLQKKDGYEVLADIQGDPELVEIPVIIISNSGQPVEIQRALDLGARDYLVKAEFSPEEVVEKVEKIFGVSHSEKSIQKKREDQKSMDVREIPHTAREKDDITEKILVIEDDKFLCTIIVQKLKSQSFQIEEAADGGEALKKLETYRPDLILLDLVLPDIDGFQILKKIKDNPDISATPVLILSNLGQEEDIRRGKEMGAKDYLIKAYFTPSEIVTKIREILRES